MSALSVENLTKEYPAFRLDNVSFEVGEGRVAGLIGRNGAGKSTTIKGILRFISATGEVKVFGRSMSAEEISVKQTLGYVGGGFRYYPLKTLAAVSREYSRFYPEWDGKRYSKLLKQFALDEGKKVRELSEGMKVKFSLALALSHNARLLIMDEPTSGLDPLSREEFCDIILSLVRQEGVSVLFSTHITSDLMRIADDIVYISDGKILVASPLGELLDRYSVARFPNAERAEECLAIGVKPVKDGYEGLIPKGRSVEHGVTVSEATIDALMIHIEQAKREGKAICSI